MQREAIRVVGHHRPPHQRTKAQHAQSGKTADHGLGLTNEAVSEAQLTGGHQLDKGGGKKLACHCQN